MTQEVIKEEYLAKCLRDYMNDKFEVEQVLFLFSYLIKNGFAKNFTKQIRETAQHFINIDWIDSNGKILIGLEEAQEKASRAQDEIDGENQK